MWTALVLQVPEAEELGHEHRMRYDPSAARGVPAHITLLSPFVEPEAIDEEALRAFFAEFSPFAFELMRTDRFPDALYLTPEPAEPISALIDAIVDRWPGYPPYGGGIDEPIPHLTLAYQQSEEVYADIASKVSAGLPISAYASEVCLIQGGPGHDGPWHERARFPLGAS